jgi:hypothetical protein
VRERLGVPRGGGSLAHRRAAIAEGDDQSAKKKAAPGAGPASGDALLADNPDDPPEVREAKRKGRLQKEAQKVAPSGRACMRAVVAAPS